MPLPSDIQLEENSPAKGQWITDLLSIPLDDKTLKDFLDNLIHQNTEAYKKIQKDDIELIGFHGNFINQFLPSSEEEIRQFNPTDDLLYRVKLLDKKFGDVSSLSQYTKCLFSALVTCRAIKLMSVDNEVKNFLQQQELQLTTKNAMEYPILWAKYHDILFKLDDEFKELVAINENNPYYRCEISFKLAALFKIFTQNASNLKSLYAFMKIAELMFEEFPSYGSARIASKINIFAADLEKSNLENFYSFELARQVCNKLITCPETLPIAYLIFHIKVGADCLKSLLGSLYKSPAVENNTRFMVAANAAVKYIFEDLAETIKLRKRLDSVIGEIIQYAREKDINSIKGEAALRLASELHVLSNKYFSEPDKNPELKQKFHSDCLTAVKKANVILAVHQTPHWKRVLSNVLLIISAIPTLGLTLMLKRRYSRMTTGYATFFEDITRGAGKARKVANVISKLEDAKPVASPRQ